MVKIKNSKISFILKKYIVLINRFIKYFLISYKVYLLVKHYIKILHSKLNQSKLFFDS